MSEWRLESSTTIDHWNVTEYDSHGNFLGYVASDLVKPVAQRIVRECNAHDDLLAACKLTTDICEAVGGVTGCWTTSARRVLAREYAANARVAIAKAEGKEAGS